MTQKLTLTSCMAPNMVFVGRLIANHLAHALDIETTFIDNIPWQERERRLDAGEIDICWICGLPYVWKADDPASAIELLAAPVMAAPRYQGRPVYFSDVVVRSDSAYHTFADLRGKMWAYNEPRSQSGYYITRYHLATLGETDGYFSRAIEAGSHEAAVQMLLAGEIDAAAIDSTVLETALAEQPSLAAHLRVIETLGPSPIPPWVIRKEIPAALKQAVRQTLLSLHETDVGRRILGQATFAKFVDVKDNDYNPIRQMAEQAELVTL